MNFTGWPGIAVGIAVFCGMYVFLFTASAEGPFLFESVPGDFEKLLAIFLDICKSIIGLASGGIVLIVGSSAFGSTPHKLPASYASPLFLLAASIIYALLVMLWLPLNYESFKQKTAPYSRWQYARNRALGYSSLACFCCGYTWLIWAAVRA